MKKLFLLLSIITLAISSCSKNEEAVVVVANPELQNCILDSFNGVYKGPDGNKPLEGDIIVKLTKTGCVTCTLESSILGNRNIVSLTASYSNGYKGKLGDGSSVQIAFNQSQVSIQCDGYAFLGTKQ